MLKREVEVLLEEKMKVEGGGTMIVDVFRAGRKGEDKYRRPRIIVARFGSVWQRNQVLKGKPNLKDWKKIGVDFDRSLQEIQELRDELKNKWEKKKQAKEMEVSKTNHGLTARQTGLSQQLLQLRDELNGLLTKAGR